MLTLYNLWNLSIVLPVNALHFHRLYAKGGEPPHMCYSWICVLLALNYVACCIFDVLTVFVSGGNCYTGKFSTEWSDSRCPGRCTLSFDEAMNDTLFHNKTEGSLGPGSACMCSVSYPYCWSGKEWEDFVAPSDRDTVWWGWAIADGLAVWTWTNTGYLFRRLAQVRWVEQSIHV
jgi:hypothetical protein